MHYVGVTFILRNRFEITKHDRGQSGRSGTSSRKLRIQRIRPLILLRKWSKLIGHHRPQTRARENRRAGSIEQAPCTVAHIADPTEELCCQSRKNTLPIWDARFCRARVASHRSGSAPRSRDASRQRACVLSPPFIPGPHLVFSLRAQQSQPPIATSP